MGYPKLRRWIRDTIPIARVQDMKDIANVIEQQSRKIYQEKKAHLARGDGALGHQIAEDMDIMSILSK